MQVDVKNAPKIIKANSKGYNYNYASLSDIAKAGFEIPKMRIKPTETGEFIEYLDDKGEWQTGSKVVVPAMSKSNEAQMYGAAITYARRVTAQLALGLVCDEDKNVETATKADADQNEKYNSGRMSFDDIRAKLKELNTIAEINAFAKEVNGVYQNPTDKQRHVIQTMFTARREEITEARLTHASN